MGGRRTSAAAVGLLLLLPAARTAGEEERGAARLVAAAWHEGEPGRETLVVALCRAAGAEEPGTLWVGVGLGPGDGPGSYGRVAPEAWTRVDLSPGVLVRATRPPGAGGAPTAVVVAERRLVTTAVRRAGVVSWTCRGRGAFVIEAIHRNGFGGTSSNLVLPPVVVVPAGTTVVEIRLR